jgi:DNA-binding response OmpR family regulator
MKILIINSYQGLADCMNRGFGEAACEVLYATDDASGLSAAMENRFDLIVLDWTLPGKGGLGVLKKLRNLGNWTPVLMLTAEESVKDVVMSLDCGANTCVTVPFETPVLLARMKAVLRRSSWDRGGELSPAAPLLRALGGR